MRELGPDRLSEDGRFLILRDPATSDVFRVPADRLSSLIDASSRARDRSSGQMESPMESSLSPRDIQSRIRRGESPDAVAEAAGVPLARIEAFAAPVLAEREFMCEQARRTTIRRKHVGGSGALLGTVVDERLAESGSPDDAAWDAWRREDGRWTVTVAAAGAPVPAAFVFDVKSRYVLPADEVAHDLVGDVALPDSTDMAIADAVRAEEPVAEPEPEEQPVDEVEPAPVPRRDDVDPVDALFDVEDYAPAHHAPVASLKEARDRRALEQLALTTEDEELAEQAREELAREDDVAVPDTAGPRKKKHERRRVPSWDEIMFGGRED